MSSSIVSPKQGGGIDPRSHVTQSVLAWLITYQNQPWFQTSGLQNNDKFSLLLAYVASDPALAYSINHIILTAEGIKPDSKNQPIINYNIIGQTIRKLFDNLTSFGTATIHTRNVDTNSYGRCCGATGCCADDAAATPTTTPPTTTTTTTDKSRNCCGC